jgi:8-oxo-dGTP pyrophosphatase MutT (NUDIX family)
VAEGAAPSFPVTPEDLPRIRALLAGDQPPVPARDAATVALIRDGAAGLEVYLMRRVRQMAFAAGMHVFPGGSVDPADYAQQPAQYWGRRRPDWWAQRLAATDNVAAACVQAAIRETQEECDVILRPAHLAPLAHWVTPELEPRRFDTRFFLAALPPGQECRDVGSEADARLWIAPQQAFDQGLRMMPPTAAVLAELAGFNDVAAAMTAQREIRRVMPVFRLDADRLVLDVPPS